MILRIDDTDVERNTQTSLDSIFDGLNWLELGWDEQYRQSERLALHREVAEAILYKGLGYRDFTPAGADAGERSHADGPWLFNAEMREMPLEESERRAAAGERFVIRYRVPRDVVREVKFTDAVYGEQSKSTADIEDFALLRSDGMPTYHLASCADDADLKISHVIRGQDHVSNTFKHVLIFEAAGAVPPQFAHLPLLVAPDGAKLSKRKHGPVVSVTTYRDLGFLPQAFVNWVCLLGWSPKDNREQLSREELVSAFTFEGVNRSNAVVNFSETDPIDPKAAWLNSQHLRSMPIAELEPRVEKELEKSGLQLVPGVVDLLRARYFYLTDFAVKGRAYFADDFPMDAKATENLEKPGAREGLRELGSRLAAAEEFTEASVEAELRKVAEERGLKAGILINGARAVLTGQSVGPSAFHVFTALGKERAVARLLGGMNILGITSSPADSASALLKNGRLVAAIEEAKISRRRRVRALPEESMAECLRLAGLQAEDVDTVALVRPFPEADLPLQLRVRFPKARIVLLEHHAAHAASAFYASPFSEATVLTLDRFGDLRCGAIWKGLDGSLELENEFFYPDSLGICMGG